MINLYDRIWQKKAYLKNKGEIYNLPNVGNFYDNKEFSIDIKKIKKYYELKSKPQYFTFDKKMFSFTSGDPINYPSFKPAIDNMKKIIKSNKFCEYPQTTGDTDDKQCIIDYCNYIGIRRNEDNKELDEYNITFSCSTTHAFSMIMELISNPGDAIIISSPNYGIFDFIPERLGVKVVTVPLRKENNYLIDVKELENIIIETNNNLKNNARVIAYLNINPHNPTGKVMGIKQKRILKDIGTCCKKNHMFVIDDLIYRDLSYDRGNIALPIATFNNYFENTITLLGISKSYGLAGVRGGVVVANKTITKALKDMIFQYMDSMPILTISALTGTFNNKKYRGRYFDNYNNKVIEIYKNKYLLFKAIIDGISEIDVQKREEIVKKIKKVVPKKKLEYALSGIDMVNFPINLKPESGFFTLLDFTKIKGKSYDDITIMDDIDLFKFLFKYGKTKVIPGSAMIWPYKDELIIRVTFAIEDDDIINSLLSIKEALKELK